MKDKKQAQTYFEKLKDPRWQKKRLEVFHASNWACVHCETQTETLHVHHLRYVRGREPWEYDLSELKCLCERCHKLITTGDALFTGKHDVAAVNEAAFRLKMQLGEILSDLPQQHPHPAESLLEFISNCASFMDSPSRHEWGSLDSPLSDAAEEVWRLIIEADRKRRHSHL